MIQIFNTTDENSNNKFHGASLSKNSTLPHNNNHSRFMCVWLLWVAQLPLQTWLIQIEVLPWITLLLLLLFVSDVYSTHPQPPLPFEWCCVSCTYSFIRLPSLLAAPYMYNLSSPKCWMGVVVQLLLLQFQSYNIVEVEDDDATVIDDKNFMMQH